MDKGAIEMQEDQARQFQRQREQEMLKGRGLFGAMQGASPDFKRRIHKWEPYRGQCRKWVHFQDLLNRIRTINMPGVSMPTPQEQKCLLKCPEHTKWE